MPKLAEYRKIHVTEMDDSMSTMNYSAICNALGAP